jgi:hypothetical protein
MTAVTSRGCLGLEGECRLSRLITVHEGSPPRPTSSFRQSTLAFPISMAKGVKIIRHDRSETCTPSTVRRDIDAADVEEAARFADK